MSRRLIVTTFGFVVVGAAGSLALGTASESPTNAAQERDASPKKRCPTQTTKLEPDAIARATDAVLRDAAKVFKAKDRQGMQPVSAEVASADNRGAYARVTCGRKVFARTVVVTVYFPALEPSASLSSSTVLVSPQRGRYRVWETVH